MALREYLAKRHPGKTPEPFPEEPRPPGEGEPIFVVQEHHASHLHWDFRIEVEGVLKSWAVPKGPPLRPGERRLAVQVEDHPYEYAWFAGTIPEGEYGAGTVSIWDRGRYHPVEVSERAITLDLHGARLQGLYYLVHTHGKNWLMIRAKEAAPASEK